MLNSYSDDKSSPFPIHLYKREWKYNRNATVKKTQQNMWNEGGAERAQISDKTDVKWKYRLIPAES